MTDRPNLCIQIGLHKTGTTMFNSEFYPKHSDIHHLGKPYDLDDPVRMLLEEIIYATPLSFDADKCHRLFQEFVLPHLSANKLVTINEARLSHGIGVDRSAVAQRLHAVFGRCKILLILRRQDELLRALYFQWAGTNKTDLRFHEWLSESWVFSRPAPFSRIDYHDIVNSVSAVFGRDQIGVFAYEEFLEDRDTFARKLSAFAGIDADETVRLLSAKARNPRMSRLHVFVRKHPVLARLAQSIRTRGSKRLVAALGWVANRSGRADAAMTPALEERLRSFVGESNLMLAQEYGLPLARYGYPLPIASAAASASHAQT